MPNTSNPFKLEQCFYKVSLLYVCLDRLLSSFDNIRNRRLVSILLVYKLVTCPRLIHGTLSKVESVNFSFNPNLTEYCLRHPRHHEVIQLGIT